MKKSEKRTGEQVSQRSRSSSLPRREHLPESCRPTPEDVRLAFHVRFQRKVLPAGGCRPQENFPRRGLWRYWLDLPVPGHRELALEVLAGFQVERDLTLLLIDGSEHGMPDGHRQSSLIRPIPRVTSSQSPARPGAGVVQENWGGRLRRRAPCPGTLRHSSALGPSIWQARRVRVPLS